VVFVSLQNKKVNKKILFRTFNNISLVSIWNYENIANMAIAQKPDGRWAVVYREDGRQRWKYFGRGAEAEAEARRYDADLKVAGNVRQYRKQPKVFSPTMTELADAYVTAKKSTMAPATLNALVHKLTAVILPIIGYLKALRLSPARLDAYVERRLKTPLTVKVGSKNAPREKILKDADGHPCFPKTTTIHRELSDIQAILNWSADRKLIPYNPVRGYAKPSRDDAIIRPPSTMEVGALVRHAAEHLKRALLIAYFTGLRPGGAELYRLTWNDVDLDSGEIFVTSARKGGLRSRRVPVHFSFAEMLKDWHADDGGKGFLIHYRGAPVKSIKTAFAAAKCRAGISRRLRPYDLRHAFATAILAAGGDLKSTSELLGHSRPDTTTRVYQHTSPELHRDAISRLPNPIGDDDQG